MIGFLHFLNNKMQIKILRWTIFGWRWSGGRSLQCSQSRRVKH